MCGGKGAAFTFVSLPATAKAIHVISKCDFSHYNYLFFIVSCNSLNIQDVVAKMTNQKC